MEFNKERQPGESDQGEQTERKQRLAEVVAAEVKDPEVEGGRAEPIAEAEEEKTKEAIEKINKQLTEVTDGQVEVNPKVNEEPAPAATTARKGFLPQIVESLKMASLSSRAKKMASFVSPYLSKDERVLDFGSGDGLVAEALAKETGANITLLDVVNANMSELPEVIYDGQKIPFADKEFEKSMSLMVLHHTKDHKGLVEELKRVTRSELIITEDIYNNALELLIVKALDLTNKLIDWDMPVNLSFKKDGEWKEFFKENGLELLETKVIRPRDFRPTRHRLYRLKIN